jgi:HEAT repeat protein
MNLLTKPRQGKRAEERVTGFERVFYHSRMGETEAERILAARITGTAARYARGRPLTEAEEAEALASLTELAAGRTDLLAQVAGLAIGFSEGSPHEPRQRQAARLLIKAGADQELIPGWIQEGRRRAESARGIPYSGGQ